MNLANTQGRRARERLLFRNKMRGKSSWLMPGGDKRAWCGEVSRGFIGSGGFWGIEGLGYGVVPPALPSRGSGLLSVC